MLAPFYFSISFGIAIFFMTSSSVQAQNFVLPAGLQASWCSTSWSVSGSTYTCTGGGGRVTFPNNAVVSSSGAVVFVANAGFDISNAKLGSIGYKISLSAPNGGGRVKSAAGAEVSGYIETLGTVDLIDTKVGGYITANGNIELSGGSVELKVTSTSNKVIADGADLLGGALGHSGITIVGGNISGDFTAHSNTITLTGVTMSSGSIDAGGNNIKVSGGSLKANITDANNVEIIDGASVTGNVQARYTVKLKGSKVRGDIYGRSGYDLQNVDLRESFVYGSVTVGDSWQTITGDNISRIYVSCIYGSVNPASLCEGGGIPPDELDECDVSLEVKDMIAGMPHSATISIVKLPPSCVPPSTLKIHFDHLSEGTPEKIEINEVFEIEAGYSEEITNIQWEDDSSILKISYREAGRLALSILDSESDPAFFVSRPYGFCIKPLQRSPISGGEGLENIDFKSAIVFKAGDPVPISVEAVRWSGDDKDILGSSEEPLLADRICNNQPTKNYRQIIPAEFREEPDLIQPAPPVGAKGSARGGFKHNPDDLIYPASNGLVNADVTLSEVGFFRITMKEPPAYLGASMSHSISQSAPIGRIIPAWLELGVKPKQGIGCLLPPSEASEVSGFTYQGQPAFLTDKLEVRGFNRNGVQTQNYKGAFWRFLGGSELDYQFYQESSTPVVDQPSAIAGRVTPPPVFTATPEEEAFLPSGGSYSYTRLATPSVLDNPFRLKMVVWNWHDRDGVYFKRDDAQPKEERGFEPTVPMPVVALIGDSDFRLGRVRSENLIVPHGNSAQAPIVLEHWNGTAWQRDVDDCTLLAPPAGSAPRFLFDSGLTGADVDEVNEWNQSYLQITDATGPEPEPQGRVLLHHLLQHSNGVGANWLCQQRSEASAPLGGVCSYRDGGDAETRSSITFGIYQGAKPLIFRREVYR